jgi:NADPH:quinone reductase-like Zn-dependent oxidoreductase
VLGRDVSGVAEACGTAIAGFQKGDEIYAMLGIDRGAYAEYVIVKANEAVPKPGSIDHLAAAGVPLAGLTAWQGLFKFGGLKAGQRVLIHAGAGGVGHFAIQFAKARGAHVITTVSEKHIEFVREIGADDVIDYKKQKFEDVVRGVDLVLDLIAGDTRERSWPALKKGGILVSTMMEPFREKAREFGAERVTVQENGEDLREIGSLIDAGKVTPKISRVFDFHEVSAAQEYVEKGNTEGKVVLKVAICNGHALPQGVRTVCTRPGSSGPGCGAKLPTDRPKIVQHSRKENLSCPSLSSWEPLKLRRGRGIKSYRC